MVDTYGKFYYKLWNTEKPVINTFWIIIIIIGDTFSVGNENLVPSSVFVL